MKTKTACDGIGDGSISNSSIGGVGEVIEVGICYRTE